MASDSSSSKEIVMTVLGCGTMGIAILSGILSSLQELSQPKPSPTPFSKNDLPHRLPSRFFACVRRPESAEKVQSALSRFPGVHIVQGQNVPSVRHSDVVILACEPSALFEVLNEEGMREALKGKLLISILAGVSVHQIEETLYPRLTYADQLAGVKQLDVECTVVRAMPNAAALVRQSMTVVGTKTPPLDAQTSALVDWIFRRVGDVVYLPPAAMDAATALCGSGPAFFALMLEAAVDGAVAMGLPRAEALRMAAQTMRGTAELVLGGEHPALLKDKVGTPGGCTIGGLLVLEEGRVRGTVARAVREAAVVAGQLGKGVQGVNGTRFGHGQFQ